MYNITELNVIVSELQKELKELKDKIAIMKRDYDDKLENIDYENLSAQLAKDIRGE